MILMKLYQHFTTFFLIITKCQFLFVADSAPIKLPLMIDQQQQQQKSAGLLLQTQKQSYLAQHSEGQDSPSCICFAQQILTRPTKPSHSAGMQQQEQEQHLSKIKGPEIKGPEMLVDDIQFV
eukprot:TRINITY_DN24549_c0_g2_i2.p3 TRINITY_DN24549_c0_g2~~TRINITY_DN24549_c0_g2_i2.p3  ORF type:complete len:122 (+),score=4.89 TRINITY_DN24549_c0_g2_i2:296-661(+)